MIPIFKPRMNKKMILDELGKIFDSGWIGLGPKTSEFEDKFAAFQDAKFGIAVNSATAALHLAILSMGVKDGDEVLVPSITFVSTALVIIYEKAVPVFVDVEPNTLNMDPADLEKKITSKTKAIVPVHYGGHACRMDDIMRIANKHNLYVIEDCAHATGGRYKGRGLGSIGHAGCFSFHAVKNLPIGDGGMIITNDVRIVDKLKRLRWLGIDRNTWERNDEQQYSWKYFINEIGYKYHMNDIAAVIGLAQLETVSEDNRIRADLAQYYNKTLKDIDWIETPEDKSYSQSAWHNYVIKIKNGKRDALHKHLATHGVSTGVHYEPIHHHKVFINRSRYEDLNVTEKLWLQLLTLPLFPELSKQQIDYISDKIKMFRDVFK